MIVIAKDGLLHRRVAFGASTVHIPLCEITNAHIIDDTKPRTDEVEADASNCLACEMMDQQVNRRIQGVLL